MSDFGQYFDVENLSDQLSPSILALPGTFSRGKKISMRRPQPGVNPKRMGTVAGPAIHARVFDQTCPDRIQLDIAEASQEVAALLIGWTG